MTLGALLRAFESGCGVVEAAGGPRGAERLAEAAAAEGVRLEPAVAARVVAAVEQSAAVLAAIARAGLVVVTVEDGTYPARLRQIELPPPVLFVLGEAAALAAVRSVAVVGTRRPSDAGRRLAGAVAAALAGAGASVVSGLAVGIDGAAHAAALAAGGPTVAVLGGGHDRLYPRAHVRLAEAIAAAGGAVVSELPPDASPCPGTFPRRNRVISGLAEATVVVEAGERSGALITAHWALEQGRGCFLVPGWPDAPRSLGCNRLLREYPGEARIVAGVAELLEDLGLVGPALGGGPAGRGRRRPGPVAAAPAVAAVAGLLGAADREVAGVLEAGAATADALAAATGLAVPTVLAVLTRLEEAGLAVAAFGRYRLADPLDRLAGGAAGSGGGPADSGGRPAG
jgi:DNA processing protein